MVFLGFAASGSYALTVLNGNFSDTSGLNVQDGDWSQGVPSGWTSTAVNPQYAVFTGSGFGNPAPAANLNTLSTLRQNIGTNSVASVVTLTFDIGNFGGGTATVRITDGAGTIFGAGNFTAGNNQTLVATTTAGGPIYIEFAGGASVWVDNVSVSSVASEVPPLGLTNGNFADTSSMTVTGSGWYGGVPAGWTTAASASDYAVVESGGVYYANLNTLSEAGGANFYPLRQGLGTTGTASDVTISFKAVSITPNAAFFVASGIFNATNDATPLATLATPAWIDGSATLTYSATNVPAGTPLYVGFWTVGATTPGITDISVSTVASAKSISIQPGSTLQIDPTSPVTTDVDLVFAAGAKVKMAGTNVPTASAVDLLSTSGAMSGSPTLDPAVEGYALTTTGKRLRLLKGLDVLNGNFQELSGLAATPGSPGWYNGVPAGWSGSSSSYNVIDWDSGNLGANVQTLGPASGTYLHQMVGRVDAAGKVKLTFGILGLSGTYGMGAAIYEATPGGSPATWSTLATSTYSEANGSAQILETADEIAANTPIAIAFWSWAGSPGIDNVSVVSVPSQTAQQVYLSSFGLSGDALLGTADPDGDGMDNDAEFAFGTSPVSGASRAATLSTGTGIIKLTYLQRNSGVTYTVKSLPDLATAFESGTTVNPVASNPQPSGIPNDYTQFEASISTGSDRGFLRVKAVTP